MGLGVKMMLKNVLHNVIFLVTTEMLWLKLILAAAAFAMHSSIPFTFYQIKSNTVILWNFTLDNLRLMVMCNLDDLFYTVYWAYARYYPTHTAMSTLAYMNIPVARS